jgi:shikimate kinase
LTPALTRHLFLVGMMGSGKSTVARLIGAELGWAVVDSDEQVERATGRSVVEIFATDGEPAFRAAEAEALAAACAADGPVVVAVAGGAVLDPANRRLLRGGGKVVWLRASTATLAARVGSGEGRPLLDGDRDGALERLSAARSPLYQEVADVVVDVDDAAPEQVAAAVMAELA